MPCNPVGFRRRVKLERAIMTTSPDIRSAAAPVAKTHPRDALAMLTPFRWNGGLAVIFALLAASFFVAGYFVIYWRNADMDLVVIYNALVMNDRRAASLSRSSRLSHDRIAEAVVPVASSSGAVERLEAVVPSPGHRISLHSMPR